MPPYATPSDVIRELSEDAARQLTSDTLGGEIDTAKIQAALNDATALIDGQLARRYAVPLSVVPDVIRGICVELAIYELYKRRGKTKTAQPRYDKAMALLGDIASGRLNLPGIATTDVRVKARDKVFGDEWEEQYD